MHKPGPHSIDVLSRMLSIQRGSRGSAQAFFILHLLHRLVSSDMRYARKVKYASS